MIRLMTSLVVLAGIVATATTAIAVEPPGWCNCNPEAPACRSICSFPDPPLAMHKQGWRPRPWLHQPAPAPRPPTKTQRRHSY